MQYPNFVILTRLKKCVVTYVYMWKCQFFNNQNHDWLENGYPILNNQLKQANCWIHEFPDFHFIPGWIGNIFWLIWANFWSTWNQPVLERPLYFLTFFLWKFRQYGDGPLERHLAVWLKCEYDRIWPIFAYMRSSPRIWHFDVPIWLSPKTCHLLVLFLLEIIKLSRMLASSWKQVILYTSYSFN